MKTLTMMRRIEFFQILLDTTLTSMVRIAKMNMYLHGCISPDIAEYDTLTMDDYWSEKFDVILANPPFMTPKEELVLIIDFK